MIFGTRLNKLFKSRNAALVAVSTGEMEQWKHKRYGSTIERLVGHEGTNRHSRRAQQRAEHNRSAFAYTPARRDPKQEKRIRKMKAADRKRNRRYS